MASYWDDIKGLAFEDRIAQTALAILYSSNHIDVTLKLEAGDETRIRKEVEDQFKREKFDNWKKSYGAKPASADAVKLSGNEQGAVNKLAKEAQQAADLKRFDEIIKKWLEEAGDALDKPPYREPDIGIIFRNYQGNIGADSAVSEVNYDTVAVTLVGDTIYLACNYKVRRMPSALKLAGFDYSGFDRISSNSRGLVTAALKQDLVDDTSSGEFAERARALKFIVFVGLETDPTDEKQSAAPHAEMQLISFLTANGLTLQKRYVGVNKACCGKCYDALHKIDMNCAEPRGSDFKNWLPASEIKAKLVDKRSIAG